MFSASSGNNSNFVPSDRKYAHSIGTNNMCGFASFVATVNAAILNPEKFYPSGIIPKHTENFMQLYMDNLKCKDKEEFRNFLSGYAGRDRELQTICATALKTAFTECMAKEFETQTSFDAALGVLIIAIITDDNETINGSRDYSELLVPAIKSSGSSEVLWNAYDAYLHSIKYDEYKIYDTAAFMKFLSDSADYDMQLAVQGVLAKARQKYAEKILTSAYMATEIDLIYLALLVGLKGIAIEAKHSGTPVFTSRCPENFYTIELRNSGIHWEAKSLPADLSPMINEKANNTPKKSSVSSYAFEKGKDADKLISGYVKLSEYNYTRDDMSANIETNLFFLNDNEINKNLFPGFIGAIISDLKSLSANLVVDAKQEVLKDFLVKLSTELNNLENGKLAIESIEIPQGIENNKQIDQFTKEDLHLIVDTITKVHEKYLQLTQEHNELLDNKKKGGSSYYCNIM